jgi:methionyl-tRNA formyltransferase
VNIVFMGTPTFALPTLEVLAERYHVHAVFTRPDAVSHRGSKPLPSLVKARALELGIPVHTPRSFFSHYEDGSPVFDTHGQRVIDAEALAALAAYQPNAIVVAAYGLILPAEVLALPTAACVNVHASLLPRWRGAAPIQRAILAGDKKTGVSIMRMEVGLDTGPFCLRGSLSALGKNYQELIVELGELGSRLIGEVLPTIVCGSARWIEQDERLVTYANKVEKGSIDLDPTLNAAENINRVRASSHHARCRSVILGQPAMILAARVAHTPNSRDLFFECADGPIEITELKPDGRRAMSGRAFKAGHSKQTE